MSEVYSMTFLIWETHDISPEILFYFSLISLAEYLHFFRHYGFTNNSGGMHSCLANLLLPEKWRTCLSMVCRSFETQRYIFLLHFCSASHFNPASQNSSLLKTHFWVILCLYSSNTRTIHGTAFADCNSIWTKTICLLQGTCWFWTFFLRAISGADFPHPH